jgi:hypothetical protein
MSLRLERLLTMDAAFRRGSYPNVAVFMGRFEVSEGTFHAAACVGVARSCPVVQSVECLDVQYVQQRLVDQEAAQVLAEQWTVHTSCYTPIAMNRAWRSARKVLFIMAGFGWPLARKQCSLKALTGQTASLQAK